MSTKINAAGLFLAAALWTGAAIGVSPAPAQSGDGSETGSPGGPADGQDDEPMAGPSYAGSREAVLDLLALVPASPDGLAGMPPVSYADLEAILRAAFAEVRPEATMSVVLPEYLVGLRRATVGPTTFLENLAVVREPMPGALGFEIGDVHRGLEFGAPPEWGLMLGLDPQRDFSMAIAAALDARSFERAAMGGAIVWHRWHPVPDRYNQGDPFRVRLGESPRVALIDGVLVGSPNPSITDAIARTTVEDRSLADDPAVHAAVAAVTDPAFEGVLLQLVLTNPEDAMPAPAVVADRPETDGRPDAEPVLPTGFGSLPPYLLVALADRNAGDIDETVVAVVYPDRTTAEVAAAILAERFRTLTPGNNPETWQRRMTMLDATVTPHVFAGDDGDPAVALVRISHRALFPTELAAEDRQGQGGLIFRFLAGALSEHALTPLMIVE